VQDSGFYGDSLLSPTPIYHVEEVVPHSSTYWSPPPTEYDCSSTWQDKTPSDWSGGTPWLQTTPSDWSRTFPSDWCAVTPSDGTEVSSWQEVNLSEPRNPGGPRNLLIGRPLASCSPISGRKVRLEWRKAVPPPRQQCSCSQTSGPSSPSAHAHTRRRGDVTTTARQSSPCAAQLTEMYLEEAGLTAVAGTRRYTLTCATAVCAAQRQLSTAVCTSCCCAEDRSRYEEEDHHVWRSADCDTDSAGLQHRLTTTPIAISEDSEIGKSMNRIICIKSQIQGIKFCNKHFFWRKYSSMLERWGFLQKSGKKHFYLRDMKKV
jgi:hypothetical protein